jgi:AcrR family transcriptional regulator
MEPREKIIEKSMDLFFRKGCKSVTMDDIAKENGVSKKTIYELFTDKTHLLEECLKHLYSQMKLQASLFEGKYNNVIEAMFRMHDAHSDNLMNLKKTFFDELKRYYYPVYKKAFEYFLEFHQKMTLHFIERGQKEGIIRTDMNKELVTKALIEISNVMENAEFFSMKEYSMKELFKEVILSYVRGLCTMAGIEIIDDNIAKMNK